MYFNTSTPSFILKITGLSFMLLLTLVSCSKEDKPTEAPEEEVVATVPYYTLTRVNNLAAESDDSNPTAAKPTLLYSLRTAKETPIADAKTSRWDVSFGGLYNSFLGGNNGSNSSNIAAGAKGQGGILIIEKTFDAVIDIPADNQFKTESNLYGADASGAFGEGPGWYLYDFDGTVLGDGSEQKKHVLYPLTTETTTKQGKKVAPRTLIVKLPNGDFAKIKIISVYKDVLTPNLWFKTTPKMFYTFEYVLAPKGSTKFTK